MGGKDQVGETKDWEKSMEVSPPKQPLFAKGLVRGDWGAGAERDKDL